MVGGWNTVFGYVEWAVLQFLLGEHLHYLVIVVISWPIAVLNAYVGYRYIVFRSRGPILRELPRFASVYVSTLLATLVALPIALHVLPFSIYVVNGCSPSRRHRQLPRPQALQLPGRATRRPVPPLG